MYEYLSCFLSTEISDYVSEKNSYDYDLYKTQQYRNIQRSYGKKFNNIYVQKVLADISSNEFVDTFGRKQVFTDFLKQNSGIVYNNTVDNIVSYPQEKNRFGIILYSKDDNRYLLLQVCSDWKFYKTGLTEITEQNLFNSDIQCKPICIKKFFIDNNVFINQKFSESDNMVLAEVGQYQKVILPISSFNDIIINTQNVLGFKDYNDYYFSYTDISALNLNNNMSHIGKETFAYSKLQTVNIENNLLLIDVKAFCCCKFLKNVRIKGCRYILDGAFSDCINLSSIVIQNCTQYIGVNVFKNCQSLRTIDLSKTEISRIGKNIFSNLSCLEQIDLPETLSDIDSFSFENCVNLKRIDLSMTKLCMINKYTFFNCSSLSSIIMPSTLEYIDCQAFYGCNSIKELIFNNPYKVVELNHQDNFSTDYVAVVPDSIFNDQFRIDVWARNNLVKSSEYFKIS